MKSIKKIAKDYCKPWTGYLRAHEGSGVTKDKDTFKKYD
jgi:hypothetical protein